MSSNYRTLLPGPSLAALLACAILVSPMLAGCDGAPVGEADPDLATLSTRLTARHDGKTVVVPGGVIRGERAVLQATLRRTLPQLQARVADVPAARSATRIEVALSLDGAVKFQRSFEPQHLTTIREALARALEQLHAATVAQAGTTDRDDGIGEKQSAMTKTCTCYGPYSCTKGVCCTMLVNCGYTGYRYYLGMGWAEICRAIPWGANCRIGGGAGAPGGIRG